MRHWLTTTTYTKISVPHDLSHLPIGSYHLLFAEL
jgi:hypothetical protein